MEPVTPETSAPALASGDPAAHAAPKADSCNSDASDESPRLFIVCGRDRNVEEVREMFARCGAIRQLHLATDRSNKSRGFAFLQYEDAASAADAIKQFDKTTLSDGHVLKVTVAREKSRRPTASGVVRTTTTQPGKLKRNQHSQDESDDKDAENSATDSGAFSGKRQRSSPPSSVSSGITIQNIWKRTSPFASLAIATRSVEDEIADVLGGIIAQIERQQSEGTEDYAGKVATAVTVVAAAAVPAAAKRKAPMALTLTSSDHAEARSATGEAKSAQVDCENVRPCKLKSQRTTAAQATPNRLLRDALFSRQRRVAVEESDSSLDDASDASVGRRKRSSTEPDKPGKNSDEVNVNSRRRLSDLSELSLSPAGISSPMTSKKRCSRRSSASSSSSSLPPFQATPFRHVAPIFVPSMPPTVNPPVIRQRRNGPRAKLFFTSTVKFTLQELEAMFSVYEQFEHVQMIKTFGRLKTMAYVKYTSPDAARSVLSSFLDDNEGEDHGMVKLVYADTDEPTSRLAFQGPGNRHTSSSSAGESTSSEAVARTREAVATDQVHVAMDENCWLMILYDRGLTNEAITSCATSCPGMEFVDIKMFRSTGESQGVAFVKFETEDFAQAASRQLHNSEFPVGSRKNLQAIVISDPALFSTPHGASSSQSSTTQPSDHIPSMSTTHHPGEDGDLGFVEARFAHLMSGGSDQPATPMMNAVPADEGYDDPNFFSAPQPQVFTGTSTFAQHPGGRVPHDGAAPYGYFQFGQPYPYGANSHPHQPPGYRQHAHPFFPQGTYGEQQPWGYENVYPLWPGEAGSPMPANYNPYSWELVDNSADFCNPPVHPDVTSVFVSSSRPLDLSSLMKAIQECPGVVGFSKEEREGVAFVVNFGERRLAMDAVNKLDGTMCNGNKLRVAVASGQRPPPSRRKRQRLDQRGRRK